MNSAEGFALIITLWRHKKSLKLVYAKTLSAKTLKLVLAINSNLKVVVCGMSWVGGRECTVTCLHE